MATPTNGNAPYNWADDETSGLRGQQPGTPPPPRQEPGPSRSGRFAGAAGAAAGGFAGGMGSTFVPPINVNVGNGGGRGGNNGGDGGGAASASAPSGGGHHQGDRLIAAVERIEFTSEKDIYALAKAINHLGRELHLILGMRAEELNGVLSQYRGKWYHFGAASRVKARLVSAHLKVSAEAAKAIGVGALKMSHSFNRHFIQPEQEAKAKAGGKKPTRKTFTIGDV